MDKFKRMVNNEPDEEEGGIMADINQATTFSWETRIKGFVILFSIGVLLSLLGSVFIFFQKYTGFALLQSFGSIISLISTCFLMGPWKQLKKMADPNRLIATIIFLLMIALTLMAGLWWKKGLLCILFCILQYLAMLWYSLSYIPYARDAIQKCVCACVT